MESKRRAFYIVINNIPHNHNVFPDVLQEINLIIQHEEILNKKIIHQSNLIQN